MDSSIQVVLSNYTCVAGGTLSGRVTLSFPLLQQEQIEEVHLKFRGSVYTYISPARTDLNETRDVDIIRDQISVWSRGSAYPPPDSHTLTIPFSFNVPRDIPPSYDFTALECRAVVRYGVEAVGARKGALRLNKRVFVAVVGLPVDPPGSQLRAILQAGWTGAWSTEVKHKQIRAGFWGEHADVSVEFKYPALPTIPLFASVPFELIIVTTSKSSKRTPGSESKPIWPAPPTRPEGVRLELRRTAYVQTSHLTWKQHDSLSLLGDLGEPGKGLNVQVRPAAKEWLSINGTKGRWRQQTTFSSSFNLACPPSFKFPTLSVEYNLTVIVPFSGLNNTLRLEIPITVSSGIILSRSLELPDYDAPPTSARPENADYMSPPPTLELPPSYWSSAE